MPGQSRSLLQFAPAAIKEEFNVAAETAPVVDSNVMTKIKDEIDATSPFHDHDYFVVNAQPAKKKQKVSYIEADVPPQGYGFAEPTAADKNNVFKDDVYVVVEDEGESQLNVNVTGSGSGTRTVVLHVPKDIK